jgi:hypothetical protein
MRRVGGFPTGSARPERGQVLGFTALEVLVSITILGIAFVPILTMLTSGTKESFYNEYHLIAETRAESLVQALQSRDFSAFAALPPGTQSALPESLTSVAVAVPEDYRRRLASFEETVTAKPIEDGLIEVTVEIGWLMPDDPAAAGHQFRLRRLLGRPEQGLVSAHVPVQGGAP